MIFVAACGIGIVETAVLWNEGSAALIDPVLFVIVLVALLCSDGAASPTAGGAALVDVGRRRACAPVPRELVRLPEVRVAAAAAARAGGGRRGRAAVLPRPALHEPRRRGPHLRRSSRCRSCCSPAGRARSASGRWRSSPSDPPRPGAANVHWGLGVIGCVLLAGVVGALTSVVIGLPGAAHPRPVPERHHARVRGGDVVVAARPQTASDSSPTSSSIASDAARSPRPSATSTSQLGARASTSCARPVWASCSSRCAGSSARGCSATSSRPATTTGTRQAFGLSPATGPHARVRAVGILRVVRGRAARACTSRRSGQQIFAPVESLRALTMVVVGGLGSVPGAILGAVFVKSTEWFNVWVPPQYRQFFTFAGSGIGLLLVLWLLPGGFGSLLSRARDAVLRTHRAPAAPRRARAGHPGPSAAPASGRRPPRRAWHHAAPRGRRHVGSRD